MKVFGLRSSVFGLCLLVGCRDGDGPERTATTRAATTRAALESEAAPRAAEQVTVTVIEPDPSPPPPPPRTRGEQAPSLGAPESPAARGEPAVVLGDDEQAKPPRPEGASPPRPPPVALEVIARQQVYLDELTTRRAELDGLDEGVRRVRVAEIKRRILGSNLRRFEVAP